MRVDSANLHVKARLRVIKIKETRVSPLTQSAHHSSKCGGWLVLKLKNPRFLGLSADFKESSVVASLSWSCRCNQPILTKNFLTQPCDATHSSNLQDSNISSSPFSTHFFPSSSHRNSQKIQPSSFIPALFSSRLFLLSLSCFLLLLHTFSLHLLLFSSRLSPGLSI